MKKIFFVLGVTVIFSCQTSKITNTWTENNISPKKYAKVLVLGILTDNDRELKFKMEDHLAKDLNDLGYNALAANKIFPPNTFVKGDTARAVDAINREGFDAVLTIVLLNKVKERQYVPAKPLYDRETTLFNRFNRYYYSIHDRIYAEGYYTENTKLFWESNFYDIDNKKLIYSSQTRSFDPGSKETLAHYYGILIANNLVKKKILLEPPEPATP